MPSSKLLYCCKNPLWEGSQLLAHMHQACECDLFSFPNKKKERENPKWGNIPRLRIRQHPNNNIPCQLRVLPKAPPQAMWMDWKKSLSVPCASLSWKQIAFNQKIRLRLRPLDLCPRQLAGLERADENEGSVCYTHRSFKNWKHHPPWEWGCIQASTWLGYTHNHPLPPEPLYIFPAMQFETLPYIHLPPQSPTR